MRPKQPIRWCAVYTRKSSEEGLEQEFNSLDAQREAGRAYVQSQRHEGWRPLTTQYDDGGYSGGTLDRPALQHLLADIRAGKVQIVVVYKVDRLTRSLADFAKLIELFDAHSVSFVSVTQQFNTTTSMGRLMLNVLLSFAQFEREVTGERIRDKIAASKKKGLWMGGTPPLGYDAKERKLVVNETEAKLVQHIFRRYAELGTVAKLMAALEAKAIVPSATPARAAEPSANAPSAAAISIASCPIASIGARSSTRTRPTRASIRRLSIPSSGIGFRPCSPPITMPPARTSGSPRPLSSRA